MLASTSSPRIRTIVVAASLHLRANPLSSNRHANSCCHLRTPSLFQLLSNPPPLLHHLIVSSKHAQFHLSVCEVTSCSQSERMSSRHSCTSARKRVHRGAAPTAISSCTCHPFRCFTTRSVQMTHHPIYENWLHCWSLRTHHTTHILSFQSVEPVSQHTDTCCEQTHRSSRCRRNLNLSTSTAHLGRSSCLGGGLSQLIASLPVPFQAH